MNVRHFKIVVQTNVLFEMFEYLVSVAHTHTHTHTHIYIYTHMCVWVRAYVNICSLETD